MRVDNVSGVTAERAYIIPAGKDCCWSRDLFDIYVVLSKEKRKEIKGRGTAKEKKVPFYLFNFDDGSGGCVFDVRVVGAGGVEWNFDKLNVCQTLAITLNPEGTEPSKDKYGRNMWVKNESKFKATEILIIQSGKDCCWLPILRTDNGVPISEKETRVFALDDGSGACEFDIFVSGEKREANRINWSFDKINVCSENKAAKKSITLEGRTGSKRRKEASYDDQKRFELQSGAY